jgi:type IV secretory pathway VirB2 component (pilin)
MPHHLLATGRNRHRYCRIHKPFRKETFMTKRTIFEELRKLFFRALLPALILLQAVPLHALGIGSSPWENAVNALEVSFTGPIARGLSLVAIVVGGLTYAFDTGGDSKRMLAGIIFGLGMALGAVQLMSWLFG